MEITHGYFSQHTNNINPNHCNLYKFAIYHGENWPYEPLYNIEPMITAFEFEDGKKYMVKVIANVHLSAYGLEGAYLLIWSDWIFRITNGYSYDSVIDRQYIVTAQIPGEMIWLKIHAYWCDFAINGTLLFVPIEVPLII